MKRQALLILCAAVIAIGITGCGKKSKDKLTDSNQSSVNSDVKADIIDVGGDENIPTVDLETGSIISSGKSNGKTGAETNNSEKTTATEDDIPVKGEIGKSDEENKGSVSSSSASDNGDAPSQSDTQTMEGWSKWKY